MPTSKIVMLALYAVMIVLALVSADSAAGVWSLRILMVLAGVHLIEMIVFYKRCKEAGGSMGNHLLNVFLFGVVHMKELKAQS